MGNTQIFLIRDITERSRRACHKYVPACICGGAAGTRTTVLLVSSLACSWASGASHAEDRSLYLATKAPLAPAVDGKADEEVWSKAPWRKIDHRWLGPEYSEDDFQGRFKVIWTEERIFLLVEVVDDILFDSHRDPLVQYWDDDCLEIFIDEDHSGGNHQHNHNAFAYHLSLDNRAIDIGTDALPRDYSHHVESRWRQSGDRVIWEIAIDVYSDQYADDAENNAPVELHVGKQMGLMLAYCDNDGSDLRENFIGSESVPTGPKDRGWIDAGLFGTLELSDRE